MSREVLQTLWSGYGEICRITLSGGDINSIVLKHISLPSERKHLRGWNSEFAHNRKVKSYDVEMNWYENWSNICDEDCRVAKCYLANKIENERFIIMEDLDSSGYSHRFSALDFKGVKPCLRWLANFHANFMDVKPKNLWPMGTYWHLATRPDEYAQMQDGKLKQAAKQIDVMLNECTYQTIVHGDAKVANFCFSENCQQVVAVDFQYVGGGCGMKDVAYLLGSCLDEKQCEIWQDELLDYYFENLKKALDQSGKNIDWQALEKEWRFMYAVAWTDFYRFVLGWMPTHKKINRYTQTLANSVLSQF